MPPHALELAAAPRKAAHTKVPTPLLPMVAMLCDTKVPEDRRHGEPFEHTLHAWLQLSFLPTYKRLLKEKRKGLVKSTL